MQAALYGNELLDRVASDSRRLARAFEKVPVARGHVFAAADRPQQHVYFPESCLASVFVQLRNGRGVHVGLIGSEGFIGLPILLDIRPVPHRVVCQIPGEAQRIPADEFLRFLARASGMRQLLLQYAGIRLAEETQHLACAALHPVALRLARWLIIIRDRFGSNELPLTHDFLAEMLAVRRPYLSRLMQNLQHAGYIEYQRGRISILNQTGLASAACEDYWVVRAIYEQLSRRETTVSLARSSP